MQNITEANFNQEVLQGKVLVDFWADWCGPCKTLLPVLEQLEKENQSIKIVKVNCDDNQELISKYGIRSIPTLILFENGQATKTSTGAKSLKELEEFIG